MNVLETNPTLVNKFRGHKRGVNSLQALSRNTIISGSDDKSVRIWDSRQQRTVQCIYGCFEDSVSCVKSGTFDSNVIFVACGSSLYSFDIRNPTKSVIIKDYLSHIKASNDDINSFDLQSSNSGHISIADDSGTVHLLNLEGETIRLHKRLSRVHQNICGCVSFHPHLQNDIVSGGFDSVLCFWDISRGRPKGTINFADSFQEDIQQPGQLANPPFVHSVSYCQNGRTVACALGDGSIALVSCSGKRSFNTLCRQIFHNGMATTLIPSSETEFLTGGVDGVINLIRIDNCRETHSPSKNRNYNSCSFSSVWNIQHPEKINDLTFEKASDETASSLSTSSFQRMFVSDISSDISVYELRP